MRARRASVDIAGHYLRCRRRTPPEDRTTQEATLSAAHGGPVRIPAVKARERVADGDKKASSFVNHSIICFRDDSRLSRRASVRALHVCALSVRGEWRASGNCGLNGVATPDAQVAVKRWVPIRNTLAGAVAWPFQREAK